jgi:DNA-binding beta-propeller fold protein YncE
LLKKSPINKFRPHQADTKNINKQAFIMRIGNYKIITIIIITVISSFYGCSTANKEITLPGQYPGYTLLPNGWKLTPAGRHVNIGELPLNLIVTKDEKYALTCNSGMGENSISVIDISAGKEIQREIVKKTWRGIAFNGDESKLFVSGGNDNLVWIYNFIDGKLSLSDSIIIGKRYPKEYLSITGLEYCSGKDLLLAVSKQSNSLYVVDIKTKSIIKELNLGHKCFDVKVNNKQTFAYISLWSGSAVVEIDLSNFSIAKIIKTGDHPCDLVITKDDSRLFVANANNNTTSVIDLKLGKEIEKLNSAISPDAPMGSTPNALCLSSDEKYLYIANADNNYLAVFDVGEKNLSSSEGFIPVGWYPAALKYLSKSDQIIVANGKGLSSEANPDGPNPYVKADSKSLKYSGQLFKGTVSVINKPDKKTSEEYTKQVYSNTPFVNKKEVENNQSIIPVKHSPNGSSVIKHVFYIIKENRTYDQVYGDIKKGNGDSSICLFGENITPNQHKLVNQFTLYDNFYVDAEVSADGHNWSTAAYATDYVEKNWPVMYGRRGGEYEFEGGYPAAAPTSGYIWNNVLSHGKTYRGYGEFVAYENNKYIARDSILKPVTSEEYPGFDLKISDLKRYDAWEKEFTSFEKNNNLPNLSLLRLPNNHTSGTKPGTLAPEAYVADNDYALGLIVERISKSKYWKESIIFVLEDDAQSGSDHVDAHRSCLMVISPYNKKNYVDHTMYSTSGVIKTMELILGLPPMTQFDLAANPVVNSIQDNADLSGYDAVKPLVDINKKNPPNGYGWKKSSEYNFTREDAAPDVEFNEIIWKAVKGEDSVMPALVKSAYVKVVD